MPLRSRLPHRAAAPGRTRSRLGAGLLALVVGASMPAVAQQAGATAPAGAASAPAVSAMDGQLFYQVLVSELALRRGEAQAAIETLTDAARRQRDERLFRRATDMAIEARAAELALSTLQEWRRILPRSADAAQTQGQILMALGRPSEAREPLRRWLELTPLPQQPMVIASLPRLVLRGAQAPAAAQVLDEVLLPWREAAATRDAARLATARIWWAAGDLERGLAAARALQQADPASEGAAMLGLEMMGQDGRAEALVRNYLQTARPDSRLRLALSRRLTALQRYREALDVVRDAVAAEPRLAEAWLMQGALQLELGQPREATAALERYLALQAEAPNAPPPPPVTPGTPAEPDADPDEAATEEEADDGHGPQAEAARNEAQAYLMLAQAAEQSKDYAAAQAWLEKLGEARGGRSALLRRASLLARQGRVDEARALLQRLPEGSPEELRSKVMAETQVLRDARHWQAAYDLLVQANARQPDDADLLYEQALLAEKLRRFDEMERLLRRVIALEPQRQHAYNALGYSLADRGQRLTEARELIARALTLAPGDPFITDSLGWLEFRSGNRSEALRLLREAWGRRPDVEIAAHLGEVLWVDGQHDAARDIWRQGRERDADNEVLRETLQRLKVRL